MPGSKPVRFLGIDSSTQGTKVVSIIPETGKVDYVDSINYDRDQTKYETRNGVIPSEDPKLSEANPKMWIDALHLLFERMAGSGYPMDSVQAISVSGQQHGLVSLDAEGNLTRTRSKLWNDYSTVEECDLLTEAVGGTDRMIEEVGNSQRPGYTAGKIYHMYRHEPDAAGRTTTFFLVHNYINWFLTGGKEGGVRIMEPGDVSGMALRHPARDEWSGPVCNAISADLPEKLPPVRSSMEMIGRISDQLVNEYGFRPDCQIDAGCGDNMYGAVGTGNIAPGTVTISLGTSGTAYTIFEEPYIDPDGEIAAFCDSTGRYLPLLCVSNMANGYNAILRQYDLNHEEFNTIIEQTSPGNDGRIIFPWFIGERTPDLPNATPLTFGFGLEDFNRENLCRGVLEGHVLNLYDGYRKMPVSANEIRLTGGLSQSRAWRQTIADIFQVETVPVEGEGAALGAAIHAAWIFSKDQNSPWNLDQLTSQFVCLDESARCTPDHAEVYNPLREAFHEMSARIRSGESSDDPFKILSELGGEN